MFNKFLIVMTISILSLYGCGGGNGGVTTTDTNTGTDTPTDTSLVFSIFAPEYFDGNYSASYSLVGSDTNGDTYTATQTVQSGDPSSTTLPGVKAVEVINVSTSITNTSTNAPLEILDNKYFLYDELTGGIKYFGYRDSLNVLAMPESDTSINAIPLTATIGNSGLIGEYIRSDFTSFSQSWKLEDGFNRKAILVVTTVSNDTSSDLYPSIVEKLLINQDGKVLGVEIIMTYHQSGNVITLTSL